MILVFLGPPGSGKGTQAKRLAEKLKVPHIALGDILREEVRLGTDIGRRAKELMNEGKLVPDELTIELTRQRIARDDCRRGFILDGFPRSEEQARALDTMLKEKGWRIDQVIYFQISQEEVVGRLSGRRSCRNCGAVYHLKNIPPKVSGRCDMCGGELYLRPDDEASVIRNRFEVYAKQTRPLIEIYQKRRILTELAASKPINETFEDLLKITADAVVP
jgi:adenylate kinase